MKLKFRLKFNHAFTNHGYLHSAVWKALYNFKIKGAQKARYIITNFSFKMFKIMRFLRSSKCSKTTVELTLTTKKQMLVVLDLTVLFSTGNNFFCVNLVQKLKIVSLSWNLILTVIQICRISLWCSLFLFLTGKYLFGQTWSKTSKLSVWIEILHLDEFEYAESNGGVHFSALKQKSPFWQTWSKKSKLFV